MTDDQERELDNDPEFQAWLDAREAETLDHRQHHSETEEHDDMRDDDRENEARFQHAHQIGSRPHCPNCGQRMMDRRYTGVCLDCHRSLDITLDGDEETE